MYVGLSIATLLSQNHEVIVVDVMLHNFVLIEVQIGGGAHNFVVLRLIWKITKEKFW